MGEEGKFKIEKFNGKNYQHWKMQIVDYLYQKDLYLPLGGLEKKPANMTEDAWEVLDRTIRLCINGGFQHHGAENHEGLDKVSRCPLQETLHIKQGISHEALIEFKDGR